MSPSEIIVDSSTLVALQRANLLEKLSDIDRKITVPEAVSEEIGPEARKHVEEKRLKGKSLNKSEEIIESTGLDRGEVECIVLAHREDQEFIVSDDHKLLRQRKISGKKYLKEIEVAGFGFLLHLMKQEDLIEEIWENFDRIIEECGWERSEVYAANYTFLTEKGYQR